jgi:ADP-ribosylglycohydrolase
MRLNKEDVFAGVFGLALGDAVGVPFEFRKRAEIERYDLTRMWGYGSHRQPKGTWSDDTSTVLATLDAMCGNFGSLGRVMDNFRRWLELGRYTANGRVFDVGGTTHRAIERYRAGEDLALCGEDHEYSNGNGSLMRMLPVAFYLWLHRGLEIDENTVGIIGMYSSLTHAHEISKECCVYYVYVALYLMAEGDNLGLQRAINKGIDKVEAYYKAHGGSCVLKERGIHSLKEVLELSESDIRSTGYVIDSLEASLWCMYHSKGFKDAVCKAVSLGGDTDTIGAITGSLAGLYYGWDKLPKDWVFSLKNKALIEDICDRFLERYK